MPTKTDIKQYPELIKKTKDKLGVSDELAIRVIYDILNCRRNEQALIDNPMPRLERKLKNLTQMTNDLIRYNGVYCGTNAVHEICNCGQRRTNEEYKRIIQSIKTGIPVSLKIRGETLFDVAEAQIKNQIEKSGIEGFRKLFYDGKYNNIRGLCDICSSTEANRESIYDELFKLVIKEGNAHDLQLLMKETKYDFDKESVIEKKIPLATVELILTTLKNYENEIYDIKNMSYYPIMNFCAQVHKSDEFTNEEKRELQQAYIKQLLDDPWVMNKICISHPPFSSYANFEYYDKKSEIAIDALGKDIPLKKEKILNFLNTDFESQDKLIAERVTADIPETHVYSAMGQYIEEEFNRRKIDQIKLKTNDLAIGCYPLYNSQKDLAFYPNGTISFVGDEESARIRKNISDRSTELENTLTAFLNSEKNATEIPQQIFDAYPDIPMRAIYDTLKKLAYVNDNALCVKSFMSQFNLEVEQLTQSIFLPYCMPKGYINISEFLKNEYLRRAEYLIEQDADAYVKNKTALSDALRYGQLDIVKYLVEHGANIHANEDEVLYLAAGGGHLDVLQYLMEQGADIHAHNDSALREAACNGHLDIVQYLVEKGANIHAKNDYALHWAAANGYLDVTKYLVEQGADIHTGDDEALVSTAYNGHLEVVQYLVEQGANIHTDNDSALRGAAENGQLDVVQYLVEQGANIHAENDYALREAADSGYLDVVQYLVEQGADIHANNDEALHWAAEKWQNDIVEYLKSIMEKETQQQEGYDECDDYDER